VSGIHIEDQKPVSAPSAGVALEHVYLLDAETGEPVRLKYAPGDRIAPADIAEIVADGYAVGDANLGGQELSAAIAKAKAAREASAEEEPEEITPPTPLAVSPSFLTFTGTAGAEITPQFVSVNTPEYLAVVPTDVTWLTVSPHGEGEEPLPGFTVTCGALDAGTYSATISVKSYDEEAPVSVSVSIAPAVETPPAPPETVEEKEPETAPETKEGENVKPETKDVRGPKDTGKQSADKK
jgi:hypothetical protein